MGHRRTKAGRSLCESLETRRLLAGDTIRDWAGWDTYADWTDAATWMEFAPSVGSIAPIVTFDLRIAGGGGKTTQVVNVGDVVHLELWAMVRNLDGNRANDGFGQVHTSLISLEPSGAGAMGDLEAITFNPSVVNEGLSDPGTPANLDGRGDLELGSNNPDNVAGYVVATGPLTGKFGTGTSSAATTNFRLGTTTWTYTGGSATTSLNFSLRVRLTGANTTTVRVYSDAAPRSNPAPGTSAYTVTNLRGDSPEIAFGEPVQISAPSNPSPPPPDPAPEPDPEPTPSPDPDPGPTPSPDPSPEPDPDPAPQPGPAPQPDPTPEPGPDPQPEPPVVPNNEAPVAIDDVASGIGGQSVLIDVLANDSDTDADALSLAIATLPAHGTVAVEGNAIRYVAAAGFSGTDTFTYTVSDGRGGAATGAVQVVTGASALLADPSDPTRTVLISGATTAADKIAYAAGKNGGVSVTINGRKQGTFFPTGRIIVNTGAGDDKVTLKKVNVPIVFNGGDGNDTIVGTAFSDVLIGGAGDDRITGGAGRDILIGGAGADRLVGGADDDVLIGDGTDHDPETDAGRAALQALLSVWTSGESFDARVTQFADSLGDSLVVDSSRDMLTGDTGRELIFAVVDGSQSDAIKGRKSDDVLVEL